MSRKQIRMENLLLQYIAEKNYNRATVHYSSSWVQSYENYIHLLMPSLDANSLFSACLLSSLLSFGVTKAKEN